MSRTAAHVYDLVYAAEGKDYVAEARELRDQIRLRNPSACSLLDVACGTGGHLRHLREWFDVAGVDVDPAMLAEAAAAVPGVPLVEGDMRSFALDRRFDAVACLFSAVGYMPTADDLATAVACMAAHLASGGVLVVDGWVRPDAWIEGGVVHSVATRAPGIAVARAGRSWREDATSVLEMHHLVATADEVEHIVERHQLTLFTERDYEQAFGAAGLTFERVESPMPGRDRYLATAGRGIAVEPAHSPPVP